MVNGGNFTMNAEKLNPVEIQAIGLKALTKALGPVGMVRFFKQFESGFGNYTKERQKLLGNMSIEDVVKDIKKIRTRATRNK